METVYQDDKFRVVKHLQVGQCPTHIPNWTIEEKKGSDWHPKGREFSKFSAMERLKDLQKRLH